MGRVYPLRRGRTRRPLFGERLPLLLARLRRKASVLVSLSLIAAVVAIGAWGFLVPEEGGSVASGFMGAAGCHPSYSGQCLPIGPDLDCDQVSGTVRVVGRDVYRLDADGDGRGCEPY